MRIYTLLVGIVVSINSATITQAQLPFPMIYLQGENNRSRNVHLDSLGPYETTDAGLWYVATDGTKTQIDSGDCVDPCVDYSGEYVFYSKDVFEGTAKRGKDIHRAKVTAETLASGDFQITRITRWEERWRPARSTYDYGSKPNTVWSLGAWAVAPAIAPDGKLIFVTNWNYWQQPGKGNFPSFQVWSCDLDGANVKCIGFLNLGGADHPYVMSDGMVTFTTTETQGYRREVWGIWTMTPDGKRWGQQVAALGHWAVINPFHFQGELSDGDLIWTQYYKGRMAGVVYGTPYPAPAGFPFAAQNPPVRHGYNAFNGAVAINEDVPVATVSQAVQFAFQPVGIKNLTPVHTFEDVDPPNYIQDGVSAPIGNLTHPVGTPNGGLLATWNRTGLKFNGAQFDVVYIPDVKNQPDHSLRHYQVLLGDPNVGEYFARPMIPYSDIYGITEPPVVADEPNETSETLRVGEPYGLIGTAAVHIRESMIDSAANLSVSHQGGDMVSFLEDEIEYVGVQLTKPNPYTNSNSGLPTSWSRLGPTTPIQRWKGWGNTPDERLPYFEKFIPVKKWEGPNGEIWQQSTDPTQWTDPPAGYTLMLGPDGQPDTSFLVKLPADAPFLWGLFDRAGCALVTGQTWHQVKAGEISTRCNGCHAHNKSTLAQPTPFGFADTFAATTQYVTHKLDKLQPVVSWEEHIAPIVASHNCNSNTTGCHGGTNPPPALESVHVNNLVSALGDRRKGYNAVLWRSRIQKFYTHVRDGLMPPPGNPAGSTPFTPEEVDLVRQWYGGGATRAGDTWPAPPQLDLIHSDELHPTVHLAVPSDRESQGGNQIIFGACDVDSGLNRSTLVVLHNGVDITNEFVEVDEVWTANRPWAIGDVIDISIRDNNTTTHGTEVGMLTQLVTTVKQASGSPPPPEDCEEQLAQCQAEKAALEQQLAQKDADIALLQQQISTLNARIVELETAIAAAVEDLQSVNP